MSFIYWIVILILAVACVCLAVNRHSKKADYDDYIQKSKAKYEDLLVKIEQAEEKKESHETAAAEIAKNYRAMADKLNDARVQLTEVKGEVEAANVSLEAANNRVKDLEASADKIYDEKMKALSLKYEAAEEKLATALQDNTLTANEQIDAIKQELASLKSTRDAAIEALRKEEEVKADRDFYRLDISDLEIDDITLLENIKPRFSNPRVISKLIWSEFYQKKAKEKFAKILGQATSGIYKITNIKDEKCYIGRSNNLYKRWCDHCKKGVGLDCPKGIKLYAAMQKEGLHNFTFEIIEECAEELLDKKESYFIDLYNAVDYGYNSRTETR